MKYMNVYLVKFNQREIQNVDTITVLSSNAESAIKKAKSWAVKNKLRYQIHSVEHITKVELS